MSGVGFSELILLFLIGLIVLGPERLPRVANQVGSWLGQARRMTRVMRRQLEEELDLNRDLSKKAPSSSSSPSHSSSVHDSPGPGDAKPRVEDNGPLHDDTYSPAHEAGVVGTGVGDAGDTTSDEVNVEVVAPAETKTTVAGKSSESSEEKV